MRMRIDEYAQHFSISKEIVVEKIKKKQLHYIVENGITYLIVPRSSLKKVQSNDVTIKRPKTTVSMVISLYQKENQQLKEKVMQLEQKIEQLIEDKEQMLRNEIYKIEKLYSAKDEQLKSIIELLNTKLLTPQVENNTPVTFQAIAKEEIEDLEPIDEIVELKSYLKSLNLQPHQRKIIKKRFLNAYNSDIRIIKENGKLYLNFSKYDYSDLLNYENREN